MALPPPKQVELGALYPVWGQNNCPQWSGTRPFAALPDHLHVLPVAVPREVLIGRLEVEADEMWSFVTKKANKQWVWIAMDKQTRQIIAFHVGDRSHASAQQLWANLPAVYREQATFYTDQ